MRAIGFQPTFDKWQSQLCGGIAVHIIEPAKVQPVRFTIDVLATVRHLYPEDFAWLPPPYEYEREKAPIDILYGSDKLRKVLESEEASANDVDSLAAVDATAWWQRTADIRLY